MPLRHPLSTTCWRSDFLRGCLVVACDEFRRSRLALKTGTTLPCIPIFPDRPIGQFSRITVNAPEPNAHDNCPVLPTSYPNHFRNLAPVLLPSQPQFALVD